MHGEGSVSVIIEEKKIAVISDTHGLLRTEARQVLVGSDLIIHAGDIGSKEIINEIGKIAKLIAVRGNTDQGEWTYNLPMTELIEFAGLHIYVIHDLNQINIDLREAGVGIVISGHSHRPGVQREKGIIYINPGSAGPKRFNLPISMAIIKKQGNKLVPEIKSLL